MKLGLGFGAALSPERAIARGREGNETSGIVVVIATAYKRVIGFEFSFFWTFFCVCVLVLSARGQLRSRPPHMRTHARAHTYPCFLSPLPHHPSSDHRTPTIQNYTVHAPLLSLLSHPL